MLTERQPYLEVSSSLKPMLHYVVVTFVYVEMLRRKLQERRR